MRIGSGAGAGVFSSSQAIAIPIVLFGLLLGYVAVNSILRGDFSQFVFVVLAFAALLVVLAIVRNWRNGLYIFLGWLLFEDLLRKYLGNNMAIYFGKDFLVALVYLSFLAAVRRKEVQVFRFPFFRPLSLFIWFGVLQVFNFASGSVVFGLLGLKLYFYYVPLLFVGYALFESEADLRRFFSFNALLVLAIGGLGIVQAIVGPSFLNPAELQEDIRGLSTLYREAPLSGAIAYRPNSIFVSTGRFANYMILSALIGFGFAGYLLLRHRRGRTLAFAGLAMATAAAIMTTSRGAFLWTLGSLFLGAIAFLWGAPWRQGEVIRTLRALQRAVLFLGLAIAVLLFTYPEALLSRLAVYSETLSPSSSASELTHRAWYYPLRNFLMAFDHPRWPYGYGIGSNSLGIQYISRILHIPPLGVGVESGYGNIVVELGIGGLILWLVWTTALVFSAWSVVRKLRGSPWFPLAFMIFWYAFLLLFPITFASFVAYQDFVLNAYLWLLVGILFRLPQMAQAAQMQAAAVASVVQPARRWRF
ncbi:MAG: hypothetical protein LAN84_08250 [Acidobacteriia bacterium]|nr:hypothetical protein [Terriglobia bacterium]